MKKALLACLVTIASCQSFAQVEVVCEIQTSNPSDAWAKASGATINDRIKQLEGQGLTVIITQLVSSSGVAESKSGTVNFDKTCAALKY